MFTFFSFMDGLAVGKANVGNLVGLGCEIDIRLILLFLYIGFMSLQAAIDDPVEQTKRVRLLL